MKLRSIDPTKLLGFDLKGEPLFDVVVPSHQEPSQSRAVGGIKPVGVIKADGSAKLAGASKLAGNVKT